jgi:hypothetical protein
VCVLPGRLPPDDAFHWIRLAAEVSGRTEGIAVEDAPCRRALGLAIDLHRRPLARLLLKAALLTCDAELGEVAAFLSLNPRVVAAYATLFFNVPGRGDENRFKRQATEGFATECDRLAATQSGQGLAEPLRRAPELTLDQLQRLLGFMPPLTDPPDAARLLLRYLGGRAKGTAGGRLDLDAGAQPRKTGRKVRAARTPAWFEDAVASAGNLMDVAHFGAAAALSGLGPLLTRQQQKANKRSQYHMLLQTFIDSGLTREQAEQTIAEAKQMRRAEAARRKKEPSNRAGHG